MIMTEQEWYHHCIETGCTMTYEEYVKRVKYLIERFRNETVET